MRRRGWDEWAEEFYATHGIRPIGGGAGEDDPSPPDDDDEDEPISREEFESLAARMRAADQRAAARETELTEVRQELHASRVEAAVRREASARDRPFADVEVVLPLLRDKVTVGDDGQPVGVDAALDALADRHPYLLVEEESAPTRTDPNAHIASGRLRGQKPTGGGIDRATLERKYPQLRRRR